MFRNTLSAMALALTATTAAAAGDIPGYDQLLLPADHRASALKTALWYPPARQTYKSLIGDNPVFFGTPAFVGAALPEGKLPLVILSHGSGGNIDAMGWLAGPLAMQGALVVGVNHPGSTSGDSSPRRSIRQSERSMDITALIDGLLADPDFGPRIDPGNITVLGFSMGGFTALSMAGITLDPAAYGAYCAEYGEAAADCVFYGKGGVDTANPPAQFSTPAPEPRVSRVIGVDAAFSHAMTEASLAQVSVPLHLIALGAPGQVPPAVNVTSSGSKLDSRIPGATLDHIDGAHHFSFLAACKPNAGAMLEEEGEDPICDDTGMRPRPEVHAEAFAMISGYIFETE